MAERRIGLRELKAKLSECVRDVKNGGTIVVTEHGRPVARMIADASSPRECLLRPLGRIVAGASHRLADLHAAEFPEEISRSSLNNPISGGVPCGRVVRRDQPTLPLFRVDVSFKRFVEFNQIAQAPLGLRTAIRKRSKVPVDSAVYQAELREDR